MRGGVRGWSVRSLSDTVGINVGMTISWWKGDISECFLAFEGIGYKVDIVGSMSVCKYSFGGHFRRLCRRICTRWPGRRWSWRWWVIDGADESKTGIVTLCDVHDVGWLKWCRSASFGGLGHRTRQPGGAPVFREHASTYAKHCIRNLIALDPNRKLSRRIPSRMVFSTFPKALAPTLQLSSLHSTAFKTCTSPVLPADFRSSCGIQACRTSSTSSVKLLSDKPSRSGGAQAAVTIDTDGEFNLELCRIMKKKDIPSITAAFDTSEMDSWKILKRVSFLVIITCQSHRFGAIGSAC
jgi:hypothetical protein